MHKKNLPPDRILSYFQRESKVLAIITASGLIYNLGLLAGPWFEGHMAEDLSFAYPGEAPLFSGLSFTLRL